MITAKLISEGGGMQLLLGLSRENINRLTAGNMMRIERASHGEAIPEGWSIYIMFGETEVEMARQCESAGLINSKTKVTMDPRLFRS